MKTEAIEADELWLGDGRSQKGHLIVREGRISAIESGPYRGSLPLTRLTGLALSPGMIDVMVCGAFGQSGVLGDLAHIAREYLRLGVTAFLGCAGNATWPVYEKMAENHRRAMGSERTDGAKVLGIYSEGPFIQPVSAGGNSPGLCQPATEENVRRMLEICGETLPMINISPEIDRDAQAVAQCRAAGKVVTMCHSNAAVDRILACVEAGTSVLGHAFDNNKGRAGDSGLQQPTLEHVALVDERIRYLHLICDGSHVPPTFIRLAARCRGPQALCLVTDALPCAGAPDGRYVYAEDGQVYHKAGGVGRDERGYLFGGALLLPDGLRNFVRTTGLPPPEAIRTVTYNPAASLGMERTRGLLAVGAIADLVAWSPELRVRRVWRAGAECPAVSPLGEISL